MAGAIAVTVADNAIVAGEFVALLVMVTVPAAAPTEVAAKVTVTGVLCPGASESGRFEDATE
jgi:hypothetical protein